MKNKSITVIMSAAWLFWGFLLQVSAQQNNTVMNNGKRKKNNKSSQKFVSYYDKFIVRPFVNGSSQDLDIKYFSRDNEGESASKNIEYRPAPVTNVGTALSYKWFGFSISTKYLNNNDTFNLSRGDPGTIRSDLATNTIGFNVIWALLKTTYFAQVFLITTDNIRVYRSADTESISY